MHEMKKPSSAILHYSVSPVVGGVEAVIAAHVQVMNAAGYPLAIITGRGEPQAFPSAVEFTSIPEIDSQHPEILALSQYLEDGHIPDGFEEMTSRLIDKLMPVVSEYDNLIIHNVFTKHFNLPLTAALYRLLDEGHIHKAIAWCHDFTWTSPSSRSKVHCGYPWDMLRNQRADVTYVVVSEQRRRALANLFNCEMDEIQVIYNGVDPNELLGLSEEGRALINRLNYLENDLNLIMPVRVTRAKNIEYALHLVRALKISGNRVKMVLTGPPDPHDSKSMEYYNSLRALRRQLGVEEEMRFVFESGPAEDEPFFIDMHIVGELLRASDLVFIPSHREGFAMPVLEAGLAGVPVVTTEVPAAVEIGKQDVLIFNTEQEPTALAEEILNRLEVDATYRLRRRVRQQYTWEVIFHKQIQPLLAQQ
jgi:glycosyltransferase involved in cell wall biosynthesis